MRQRNVVGFRLADTQLVMCKRVLEFAGYNTTAGLTPGAIAKKALLLLVSGMVQDGRISQPTPTEAERELEQMKVDASKVTGLPVAPRAPHDPDLRPEEEIVADPEFQAWLEKENAWRESQGIDPIVTNCATGEQHGN